MHFICSFKSSFSRVILCFNHFRLHLAFSLRKMSEEKDFHCNIGAMRAKYHDDSDTFTEKDLAAKDPVKHFQKWLNEAVKCDKIMEANAMCLATANRNGMPSARYVLLKGYGSDGFDFFTNYNSRKACDLEENPQAALTFYWEALKRQVRIEGKVVKLPEVESDEYFCSRPKVSQVSASVSKQSSLVASRDAMLEEVEEFVREVENSDLKRPKHWGGYRVIPSNYEFWQGQSNRLHDRIRFRKLQENEIIDENLTHKGDGDWVYERLYP
ncbi:pyridoxine-5'-phosphate oxidase [Nilaparvata lugens]|uniref:pyridoxine-5'-phosphate oxidase n=1 Tax=Nilaparvata lugens TaxID=108931 RepID=UPI00193D5166|nr:pyridoxine-5'-phosphate oxidase [Nilaparvata lugens]